MNNYIVVIHGLVVSSDMEVDMVSIIVTDHRATVTKKSRDIFEQVVYQISI